MRYLENNNRLVFTFPDIHPYARLGIELYSVRTNIFNQTSPLFIDPIIPLTVVDQHANVLPESWLKKGGILAPVRPNQAVYLVFWGTYPWAVKVGSGKVNLINNSPWGDSLDPEVKDFVVTDNLSSFSGYKAEDGKIRQLIVSPLGRGMTIEEQVSGTAHVGGIQLIAYPMTAAEYKKHEASHTFFCKAPDLDLQPMGLAAGAEIKPKAATDDRLEVEEGMTPKPKSEHEEDEAIADENRVIWETGHCLRTFIHLIDERDFLEITGRKINGKKAKVYSMAYWRAKLG